MSSAVLYRWKLKAGTEETFRKAWAEGTHVIHKACASFGARLHEGADGLYWSYARWPSEEARQACFESHHFFDMDCFKTMQACIEERFPEVVLTLTDDELAERKSAHDVPVYETDRLILRPVRLDDAEALAPALMDEANMKWWSRGALGSVDEVRDYLVWNVRGDALQCWVFALNGAPDDALGWVILMDKTPGQAEIGYMQRPDAQGNGYALEAASKMLDHAFNVRKLRRVWGDADPDNAASIRLMEKLGMEYEGRLKANWETHIGVRDSVIYGIVAPDSRQKDA
ncbi:GNAT family N-acetyltransferase [Hyphobacterium sp. HN65]|uniref:GNAT family N-acetyltransferase n=1 Tax=Hyphobacterium lacteum TaxID=3116575 RepID=A0ABU7LT98_9PROT|nr:GNAT family N-acetyltransferase [Hyphobacterium sp. HN65]MEE2526574.1 GNAT family N-acetyltransferase [Hyphobacterium sp. HN65]